MTIKELAQAVANEINKSVIEDGFETFKEMKKCYWWDAADVRDEISYIANDIATNTPASHITVMDDGAVDGLYEDDNYKYIEYGEFKKMVLSLVK